METSLSYSDNIAGNRLLSIVVSGNVNDTMETLGYPNTRIQRKFMDTAAQAQGLEKLTTANNMADMISRILALRNPMDVAFPVARAPSPCLRSETRAGSPCHEGSSEP